MLHLEPGGKVVVLPIHFTGFLRPFRKIKNLNEEENKKALRDL
jgi:hypothetical protein